MANPYPNERELFEKISTEKITIPPSVWDMIYNLVGDHLTAINLLAWNYAEEEKAIPIEDVRKISSHIKSVIDLFHKINRPENIFEGDENLLKIKKDILSLNVLIRELFGHYIGNDSHVINMIVDCALDKGFEEPVSVEAAKKILSRTASMKQFMDKLWASTSC